MIFYGLSLRIRWPMNRIPVKCPLAAVVILGGVVWLQHSHAVRLRTERDRYQSNSTRCFRR